MTDTVKRVKIQATADLKGFEDAAKALKDLQRAVGPTDAALAQARREIIEFGNANKRTESTIQAQINALQKLRQQSQLGGSVYTEIGKDIENLKRLAAGSTRTLDELARSIRNAAGSTAKSVWQQQTKELAAFNKQAGQTGKAVGELAASFGVKFEKTSQAIAEASREIAKLKQNAGNIGSLLQGPAKGGGPLEFGRKGLADIQAFSQLVTRLKEQTETATGKVARLSEGFFAAAVAGKGIGATIAALGGVAGAAENVSRYAAGLSASFAQMGAGAPQWASGMKGALNQIALSLNEPANGVLNWVNSLTAAQNKLTMLNVPLEAFNNALAAIGPEGAAVAGVLAVSFAGLQDAITRAFRAGDKEASEALQSITDETQRLINKLAQLSEAFRGAASMNELQALRSGAAARFNETPAGTDASRRAANSIANAESMIKAEAAAQAQVLENARQRYRGTAESVDALSERLAYLQSAMKLVDQSTTEGKAEFTAFASESAQLKRQIDALSNSYRTVADAIRDAAAAQGQYANQSTTANYLNRAAVRRQEEIAAAARAQLARPQTPLLPAAGQTSFAGDVVNGLGGGARRPLANFETAGTRDIVGAAMSSQTEAATRALDAAQNEVQGLERAFNELIRPVETVAKSDFFSPKSINALKARREQIDRERNSVEMLGKDYNRLTAELARVDKQLERTQVGGLRGKIGYIGQGIGAAASAGIFGGPEGALGGIGGGAIGALLGGPAGFAAGSFIGSSVGAYAGMARQSLGQFSTYAADISKLEIALKGVTRTQEEYQRALAASASVTRDFNVPQLEATKGMTQLSAAVIGAGGKVADAEVVFRNVTAAIKASGGTSEDVQGALTALGQIFSKGKVSAEELQGQLGERLPGAVTMFAKATGRTLPQLQKDLEQGVVGLADLMKFVVSEQGLGQFEQRAKAVAQSSADAGARLTATWNDTKRAIGEALLPLGAQIQDSLAQALRDATPALVGFAQGLSAAIKVLVDNGPLIGNVLKTLLGLGAVAGVAAAISTLGSAFAAASAFVVSFGGAATVATLAVESLGIAIAAVPGIGWIAAGVTGLALLTKALYDNNDAFRAWVNNVGTIISTDFKNAWDFAVAIVNTSIEKIKSDWNSLVGIASKIGTAIGDAFAKPFGIIATVAENIFGGVYRQIVQLINSIPEPIRKRLYDNAVGTGASILSMGNPVAAYGAGVGIRALTGGAPAPDASSTGMYGRYDSTGGKGDYPGRPSDLTDWKIQQEEKEKTAKAAADRTAANEQQLQEALAKARIALDDAVHRNAMELIRKRYEYEQELSQKQRDNWVKAQTGAARATASIVAGFMGELQQMQSGLLDARDAVKSSEQQLKSATAMAAVTTSGIAQGGGSAGRVIEYLTGDRSSSNYRADHGGSNYHEHLAFETAQQMRKAMEALQAAGIKIGSTTGGRHAAGSYHYTGQAFDVPASQVPVGQEQALSRRVRAVLAAAGFSGAGIGGQGGGSAAAQRRDVAAEGSADVARAELDKNNSLLKLYEERLAKLTPENVKGFVLDITDGLRQQNATMKDSAEITALRNRLQLEGVRPEIIDSEVKKAEAVQQTNQSLALLQGLLSAAQAKYNELKASNKENTNEGKLAKLQVDSYSQAITGLNEGITENIRLTNEATAAQITFADAMRFRQDDRIGLGLKEGAQQYVESIGTMRQATAELAQNGIKGVEEALFSLATTGTANFREFAADILKQTARMIIQQLVLRTIMQAIGAIGGGGGGAAGGGALANFNAASAFYNANGNAFGPQGVIPYAMGGIVTRPTLFKFANGGYMNTGLMGEAGPEAIMPLKRGRDGRLGVSGGGGSTTVNVSVDATGSSVQGNAGQGEALGRAVAQAVQAELVRQKRPGGLLAA